LKGQALAELRTGLDPSWRVVDEHRLEREYAFRNFVEALDFVNRVGDLSEKEGHHPWIHFTYGKVRIELWTHKIDGLAESDFILAAKIDTVSEK
jgi:4a-hydroxytetrahydrobiopterin dehydratase